MAVGCINYHAKTANKQLPVLFVVPTRALVTQQAMYCRRHCTAGARVGEIKGDDASKFGKDDWITKLKGLSVLLGTPEVRCMHGASDGLRCVVGNDGV